MALARCAISKAISEHFCHYYHEDCRGWKGVGLHTGCFDCRTEKPDWSCKKCMTMDHPLRRRFNIAPKHLSEIIEREVHHCLKTSNNSLEPSNIAEKIIHMWMDTSIKVRESVTRRRYRHSQFIDALKLGGYDQNLTNLTEEEVKQRFNSRFYCGQT